MSTSSEVFMMEQLEIIAIALEKRLKHNVAGKQLL
jgi:hypothetical protein